MRNDRSIVRDLTAMAAGLAVGVIGSRLLPPVIAQTSGSIRARLGEDPFKKLVQDHRHIVSTLYDMEQTSEDDTAQRAKLFLSLKRTLAKHMLAEEDVVYPLLHDEVRDVQETKHLYDEHSDMKIHLFELEQILMSHGDWNGRVRALRNLIERHVREEEEVQFPKLRRALDERRTRTLSQNILREEALVL